MSLVESVYDQTEETTRLQHTLRDQIRRSTAMLQTLQSSGQMIEGLVRGHFREMQVNYGEKFGSALYELSRRVERLEGSIVGDREQQPVGGGSGSGVGGVEGGGGGGGGGGGQRNGDSWGFKGGPPSASVNGASSGFSDRSDTGYEVVVKGIMERLERLEKEQ
ncbi:hypothetical protein HKX48_009246 [Thoreauomyces humboldtii]|nr:hypothetical protein HKX48_009246 [Thoreauomyces humboldtii]